MKPELGDLIEIFRTNISGVRVPLIDYQHWAVYVGDGYVVHLVNLDSDSFSSSSSSSKPQTKSKGSKGKIKRQKLKDVAGNDEWRVNNKLDNKRSPRPAKEIVQEALSLVGQDMFYHVTKWNCEHFVNKLRYGVRRSWQVLKYTLVAGAGYLGGAVGTLLGPLGTMGGAASAAVCTKALLDKLD